MSNILGGFASNSVLPVIDGVNVFVGDVAYTVDEGGLWQAVQPTAPPGATPVWAYMDTLRGAPGPQGPPGVGAPGSQGQIGPQGGIGATGPQGPPGKTSFSYLSVALSMPPVSTTPTNIGVTDTSWMSPGLLVYIPGLGTMTVVGTPPGPNNVNLVNSGDPNNKPVGTTVQGGTVISPASQRGPAGPQGGSGPAGPPGPQGVSGTSVYTTLAQSLTVPPVGSSVTAFVVSAAAFGAGQIVYVAGGDYFSVSSVNPANNTMVLVNQGYPGGAPPATVIPVDATVSGTGPQGPQGPIGPQGIQGTQGITGVAPTGTIVMYAAPTPPGGWINCDGSTPPRTQYPGLFSIISTNYNTGGEDPSTFRLPNLQGRFPLGAQTGNPLGSLGGEATHTLLEAELAVHTHGATSTGSLADHQHGIPPTGDHTHTDTGHTHPLNNMADIVAVPGLAGGYNVWRYVTGPNNTGLGAAALSRSGNIGPTATYLTSQAYGIPAVTVSTSIANRGSSTPHNNMPPYQTVNYIIKT